MSLVNIFLALAPSRAQGIRKRKYGGEIFMVIDGQIH